jgi:steroid delta-isomerase-like uncharacterized protein
MWVIDTSDEAPVRATILTSGQVTIKFVPQAERRPATSSQRRGVRMPVQQMTELFEVAEYERKWVEGLNRGDTSSADLAFAPDCVIHITGAPASDIDLDIFKQMVAGLLIAFPDLHFTIEDQIISGEKVAMRWFATGTHTGPLGAAPPTGKPVRIGGLIFDRVVDGRVAERWEQWDQPAMLQQLGFA